MRAARRLSSLATLFLFSLTILTPPARTQDFHPWDAPLDDFASKIAASLEKRASIELTVRNISSIDSATIETIRRALESDLQRRGLRIRPAASTDSTVEVTFSENVREFIWAAEIRRGESRHVVIENFPRSAATTGAPAQPPLRLERRQLRQQSEAMLDFALLPSSGSPSPDLVVLEPERLVVYHWMDAEWQPGNAVVIPHANPWPRDLRGELDVARNAIILPGVECTSQFQQPFALQCNDRDASPGSPAATSAPMIHIAGRDAADFARLRSVCNFDSLILASGAGDWTQPDTLQAYEISSSDAVAAGTPLDFAGPILALHASTDGASARVISRNPQTGMYEAAIVTISCNR